VSSGTRDGLGRMPSRKDVAACRRKGRRRPERHRSSTVLVRRFREHAALVVAATLGATRGLVSSWMPECSGSTQQNLMP